MPTYRSGIFRPSSRTLYAGFLAAFAAASAAAACSPAFTDCRSRRTCKTGGTGGSDAGEGGWAGDPGPGGGGTLAAGGSNDDAGAGIGGTDAAAGSGSEPDTSVGGEGSGGTHGPAGGTGNHAGATSLPEAGAGGVPLPSPCEMEPTLPRLIAPLSTAMVTSSRPTVEFERGEDCNTVEVDFCLDRDCTNVIETVEVSADTSTRPESDLPRGVVFWRARSGDQVSAVWQFTAGKGAPTDTWWGTSPDFNGDGKTDVAVGASGAVYVYYGNDTGLNTVSYTVLTGGSATLQFGIEVASAGDVNGDGFADLVVSSRSTEANTPDRLYIYLGGKDGLSTTAFKNLIVEDSGNAPKAGADINGDGYSDFLLFGMADYKVFFGAEWDILAGRTIAIGEGYTTPIVFCDLNADRRVDMLGSMRIAEEAFDRISVFEGSSLGFASPQGIPSQDLRVRALACADFANDGYADVIVGDMTSHRREPVGGDVQLFKNASGNVAETGSSLNGQPTEGSPVLSGSSVTVVGDMDGDGFPDLAVGSSYAARVMFSTRDPAASDWLRVGGAILSGELNPEVVAGDVNGDGLGDVVFSSPEKGRVEVFLGSRTDRVITTAAAGIDAPEGVTNFGQALAGGL